MSYMVFLFSFFFFLIQKGFPVWETCVFLYEANALGSGFPSAVSMPGTWLVLWLGIVEMFLFGKS